MIKRKAPPYQMKEIILKEATFMTSKLKIGSIAPDFELPSWKNDLIKLQHFRGRYLTLVFIETIENDDDFNLMVSFSGLMNEFSERNTIVVGISKDDTSTLQEAVTKHQIQVMMLSDVLTTTYAAYNAIKLTRDKSSGTKQEFKRKTIIIDPNGKIIHVFDEIKDASTHPNEVLDWLKTIDAFE